jgi:hypothetical protein
LNKVIIDASESAARAERGELGNETAVAKILDAEKILDDIKRQSSPVQKEMITPEQLRLLLGIPKAMLQGEIKDIEAGGPNENNGAVFRTVGYTVPTNAADVKSRIESIIYNIRPSGWWTLKLLSAACLFTLKLYKDEATRKPLIRSNLQLVSWAEAGGSALAQATSSISTIRF